MMTERVKMKYVSALHATSSCLRCRGKKPGQEVSSRCSTDMEALRKQKRAM